MSLVPIPSIQDIMALSALLPPDILLRSAQGKYLKPAVIFIRPDNREIHKEAPGRIAQPWNKTMNVAEPYPAVKRTMPANSRLKN